MKHLITILTLLLMSILPSFGQTIAVPGVHTAGLQTSQEVVNKLLILELVKIQKYQVYDEFDLKRDVINDPKFEDCYGKGCLIKLGKALEVDYVLSGSVDGLGNKIIVSLKLIDVKDRSLKSTISLEFDNLEIELQRMIGLTLQQMHKIQPDLTTKKLLSYKEDVIVSTNVGRVNNSGPRVGIAYVSHGDIYDFYTTRSVSDGGLNILPIMTNMGYQFETSYIGTDNFSALIEVIPNISGMDQGQFIPSISIMNGFRFGKSGWEFAFGPTIGIRKLSTGFIDSDGSFVTEKDYVAADYNVWKQDTLNWNSEFGYEVQPYTAPNQEYKSFLDTRGEYKLRASWIMGVGRTFRAGALNIPVNLYYSSDKYGGILGFSVGFNITKNKFLINK
ncbi:hypothetical protein JYT74_02610 [Crocinitomix catalasitica]|nr:hypothetical protein [Crocinitomix catalasitica]